MERYSTKPAASSGSTIRYKNSPKWVNRACKSTLGTELAGNYASSRGTRIGRRHYWGGAIQGTNVRKGRRIFRAVAGYRVFSTVMRPIGFIASGFKYGALGYCNWECRNK